MGYRHRSTVCHVDLGDLLAVIAAAPDLHGAACATPQTRPLFDASITEPEARVAARKVCASCPALAACDQWVAGLHSNRRPPGVVAGRTKGRHSLTAAG